jgi:hypothetical protein
VPEISSRLDQRFRLLTGGSRTALPRHQTLRALIDWPYDLLIRQEQLVLDRLSVFAGDRTLKAAEAVTSRDDSADWQVLDLLAALIDKSLVQADDIGGSTRYRLLETVRQYAAERLALRPGAELEETRSAHRDYYLALVETASAHLRGRDEATWLDRLEVEFDNIRAALAFSAADPHSAEPGLQLAAGLRWFCNMRGHGGEVLENLGFAGLIDGDSRNARRHFLDSLDTAPITGVKPYVHAALLGLALAAGADGEPTVAATLHGVADEYYERAGRAPEALEAGLRDRDHARLRATLGDAGFDAAYRYGRTLSQADAIALTSGAAEPGPVAVPVGSVPGVGPAVDSSAGPLSDREREIVALLADGASDAPDRQAAVPVGQHGAIAPGADPGQDRRPPPRGPGPLCHPGGHRTGRPFPLRTGQLRAGVTGLGGNGAIRPTPGALDGAARPLPPAPAGAHAGPRSYRTSSSRMES